MINEPISEEEAIFYQMVDLLENLRATKPTERSEKARRFAVTLTEMEKVAAYYHMFVVNKDENQEVENGQ